MTNRCPDSCEHRVANGDNQQCKFIGELLRGLDASAADVNQETCEACCRSFLPTRDDLNPVVASLLWSRCENALTDVKLAADSEITERLTTVRNLAEASLPLVFADEDDLPTSPASDETKPRGTVEQMLQMLPMPEYSGGTRN